MAVFAVYDLLDEKSLLAAVELKKRISNSVCMLSGDPIPVYLIGNKVMNACLVVYVHVYDNICCGPVLELLTSLCLPSCFIIVL